MITRRRIVIPESVDEVYFFLKSQRAARGMTYRDIADKSSITYTTAWRIETRQVDAEVRTLESHVSAFGYKTHFLFEEELTSESEGFEGLAQRAFEYRKNINGLTLEGAAEEGNICFSGVRNVEKGQSPRLKRLFELASLYRVKPIAFVK